jgi:hypothetical protein
MVFRLGCSISSCGIRVVLFCCFLQDSDDAKDAEATNRPLQEALPATEIAVAEKRIPSWGRAGSSGCT